MRHRSSLTATTVTVFTESDRIEPNRTESDRIGDRSNKNTEKIQVEMGRVTFFLILLSICCSVSAHLKGQPSFAGRRKADGSFEGEFLQFPKDRPAPRDDAVIKVNPDQLCQRNITVSVAWDGVVNANASDWVGIYYPDTAEVSEED